MIKQLKKILREQKIDFFLLPNSDEFFSEYLPENEKRIEFLTGFNGSNATIIFGEDKSYFFTDGRYILQAENQLDSNEFEIFNIAETPVISWLENNLGTKKLALDAKLHSILFHNRLSQISKNILLLKQNPIEQIWQNRPNKNNSAIFFLNEVQSGKSSAEKRHEFCQKIHAEAALITKPENICWLLNLRASDIEFTPILLAYAIIFKNGKIDLFTNESRIADLENPNLKGVNIVDPNCLDLRFAILRKTISTIEIDPKSTNCWIYEILKQQKFEILPQKDFIELPKSLKNLAEINGAKKCHEIDGEALTKFLLTLKNNWQKESEISAAQKLLNLRRKNKAFFDESFAAISGFAANGAIIHYRANAKTNKKFSSGELYLIDSGGQYLDEDFCGTTDVTRTIAIGEPSAEMIENFTRVLKGHIALARAKFPRGTTGAQLDVLARSHLWQSKLNYDHGTGHGVGSFLSVHEGPCAISSRNHQELLEGMIISNEPGFYKENAYGIRTEGLMLVKACDQKFLHFEMLTLAPIDADLVDFKMLTKPEKMWLAQYHQKIWQKFSDLIDEELQKILQKICAKYDLEARK